MLSQKALQEFKNIYQEKFGKELSEKDTLDKALRVLNLYKAVYSSDNFIQKSNVNQMANKNERKENK